MTDITNFRNRAIQSNFDYIHTEVMKEVIENPGKEEYADALLQLIIAYNNACKVCGWEVKHKLGELL